MAGGGVVDGVRRWLRRRRGRTASAYQPLRSSSLARHPGGDGGIEVVPGPFALPAAIRVPARNSPPPPDAQLGTRFVFTPARLVSVVVVVAQQNNSFEFSGSKTSDMEFFTEYGEASQYQIQEVVGKGSYGVVAAAVDTHTGERVAIKKINDVFEHVSDAIRILREIKVLRLLRHPDIVAIKHIMLPPTRREFRDIYVVFELMESDLHQVIEANHDLSPEHHRFFLYQLLCALKYIHSANVFHRDLKPKNILANSDCKLKICDFGLARVAFNDSPSTIFWTDYVATRWYRAPELCGSFFSKYTPAIDIWSIGCIFAEILTGRPLFPGRNVVHQLDLITDLLGTPSSETLSRIRNENARGYLTGMQRKHPIPFSHKFHNADPLALRLLERLLAFDPKDRPTAEEALADPYFRGISKLSREPSRLPVSKFEFEFERRKLTKDDVREMIYREILEYHPQMLQEYIRGGEQNSFLYPSGVDRFKRQFAHLEENYSRGERSTPLRRQHASLPRERVCSSVDSNNQDSDNEERRAISSIARTMISPPRSQEKGKNHASAYPNGIINLNSNPKIYLKSASISASTCIIRGNKGPKENGISEDMEEVVYELSDNVTRMLS
uniref:mitogen-activated protein kinase n=2 Tax=Oryza TaxID=4527 RepID=A0A0D3F0D1_9ORYZ